MRACGGLFEFEPVPGALVRLSRSPMHDGRPAHGIVITWFVDENGFEWLLVVNGDELTWENSDAVVMSYGVPGARR